MCAPLQPPVATKPRSHIFDYLGLSVLSARGGTTEQKGTEEQSQKR